MRDEARATDRLVGDGRVWGRWLIGLVLIALASANCGSADAYAKQELLAYSPDGFAEAFGGIVAVSGDGDTIAVGQHSNGRVVVFARSGGAWSQQGVLLPEERQVSKRFGEAVDISADGDTVIVGAYEDDSASVFTRTGTSWSLQQVLTPGSGDPLQRFGRSVALSDDGDTALIGAYASNVGGYVSGGAFVFGRSAGVWSERQVLRGNIGDQLGYTVALSGDGTRAVATTRGSGGSAKIYRLASGTWSFEALIERANAVPTDSFGDSAAMSFAGDTVVVGDRGDDVSGNIDQGSAAIFTRSGTTWSEGTLLTFGAGKRDDHFGESVAITDDGDRVLAGVPGSDLISPGVADGGGRVVAFERSGGTWTQGDAFSLGDIEGDGAEFGYSVALAGDATVAVIGAPGRDTRTQVDRGAVAVLTGLKPGKPRGVGGTVANASSLVSWSEPLSDGGATVTGYVVTASPGGASCSTSSVAPVTPATSCTVSGLSNGTSYTFSVVASNAAGAGAASDPSTGVVPRTVPGKPASVRGTPADQSIVVTWSAPASDGGATITRYVVTASPGGATCVWSSGPLACTFDRLLNGASYTFAVTATNTVGAGSASIASAAARPRPITPTWSLTKSTKTVKAAFKADPGMAYSVSAARGTTVVTGTCSTASGTVTCTVKASGSGAWVATIKSQKPGLTGTPVKYSFSV